METKTVNDSFFSLSSTFFEIIEEAVARFEENDLSCFRYRVHKSALTLFGKFLLAVCQEKLSSEAVTLCLAGFDDFCLGLQCDDLQKNLSKEFVADFSSALSNFLNASKKGEPVKIAGFLRWSSENNAAPALFFFSSLWLSCKFWCSRLYQIPLDELIETIQNNRSFFKMREIMQNETESSSELVGISFPRFFVVKDVRICEMVLLRCSKFAVPIGRTCESWRKNNSDDGEISIIT